MNKYVIETKQLTKTYGEQTVVNSVNIHVKQGQIYGLLGPACKIVSVFKSVKPPARKPPRIQIAKVSRHSANDIKITTAIFEK